MRTLMAPLVLLSLITAGCAGDAAPTSTAPTLTGYDRAAAASGAVATLTISGRCEVTFTPPPFPLPPLVTQSDAGTCQLSHLGQTAFNGVQEINFAAGTQRGERTFTAANGDVLRAVHVGRSAPSGPGLISFEATLTFVGGTGRFAHATGRAVSSGVANLITHTTSLSLDGSISYDASDRNGR